VIYLVLTLLVILLSSSSLIMKPIPENTPYPTNDSFWITSHHYQRVYYSIIVGAISFFAGNYYSSEMKEMMPLEDLQARLIQANIAILVLQMIGLLSNPFVTLLYAFEQLEVFVYGSTPRASDIRIVLSFLINSIFVGILYYLTTVSESPMIKWAVIPLVAFLASHNLLSGFGLPKKFKSAADESDSSNGVKIPHKQSGDIPIQQGSSIKIIRWSLKVAEVCGILIILIVAFVVGVPSIESGYKPLQRSLSMIGVILAVIVFGLAALTKRVLFRSIRSVEKDMAFAPVAVSKVVSLLLFVFMLLET